MWVRNSWENSSLFTAGINCLTQFWLFCCTWMMLLNLTTSTICPQSPAFSLLLKDLTAMKWFPNSASPEFSIAFDCLDYLGPFQLSEWYRTLEIFNFSLFILLHSIKIILQPNCSINHVCKTFFQFSHSFFHYTFHQGFLNRFPILYVGNILQLLILYFVWCYLFHSMKLGLESNTFD